MHSSHKSDADDSSKPNVLWGYLICLGVMVRLLLACTRFGSPDVATWEKFGAAILDRGIGSTYAVYPEFNHPPVISIFISWLVYYGREFSIPFAQLLKLASAIADMTIIVLVYIAGRLSIGKNFGLKSGAFYSLSVCSILISSVHGNTDSECLALVLAAVLLLQFVNKGFLAGLAFGAALNVKLIPLLLLPPLLSACRARRIAYLFSGGVAIGLIPIVWAAIAVGQPFIKNVLSYVPPTVFLWGAQLLLPVFNLNFLSGELAEYGKYLLLAIVTLMAIANLAKWRLTPLQMSLLTFYLFTAFAPVFALQYTVYLAPFFTSRVTLDRDCIHLPYWVFACLLLLCSRRGRLLYTSQCRGARSVPVCLDICPSGSWQVSDYIFICTGS